MIEMLVLLVLGLWLGLHVLTFLIENAVPLFILAIVAAGITGVVYLI